MSKTICVSLCEFALKKLKQNLLTKPHTGRQSRCHMQAFHWLMNGFSEKKSFNRSLGVGGEKKNLTQNTNLAVSMVIWVWIVSLQKVIAGRNFSWNKADANNSKNIKEPSSFN